MTRSVAPGRRLPVRARAGPARRAGRPRGGGELADVISLAAQAQAEGDPERVTAIWDAGVRSGRRSGTGPRGREGSLAERELAGPAHRAIPCGAMSLWASPGRVDNLQEVPQPRRIPPKSRYTSDRLIPGAFERDRHAAAAHGPHRPGRRRGGGDGVHAARARLRDRLGRVRAPARDVGGRRSDRRLPGRHLRPEGDHDRPGHRRGRQDHRLHPRLQPRDRRREGPGHPGRRRLHRALDRCMHLGCPVRFVEASERFICPCHGGVYDFTGQVDGGPPVRPLDRFYTRVQETRSRSARATRSTPSSSASRATAIPARTSMASASTSTPGASRRPSSTDGAPQAPTSATAAGAAPRPKRPGQAEKAKPLDQAKEAGIHAADWVDERTSLSGRCAG